MALKKRGKTWWVDFTTPSGERIRCTSGTTDRNQAQEFHDKLKVEAWRVHKLGDRPNYTWDEAAHRWLVEKSYLRSYKTRKLMIGWWHTHFRGMALKDITRNAIQEAINTKRGVWAAGTTRVHLDLICAVLRRAMVEWEWLDRMPPIPRVKDPKKRIRWLTSEEALRLLQHLPEYMAEMMRFALATGLRQRNVMNLEWSQVDLDRKVCWIYGDQAKAGKDIHVTLNETAMGVFERQKGKHPQYVFVGSRNQHLKVFYREAWAEALKAAGIENFRWHDLRHTWASWLVQNGTPLNVLQEMGGWATYDMVQRYAHLSPEQFTKHASVVDRKLNVTNLAQPHF